MHNETQTFRIELTLKQLEKIQMQLLNGDIEDIVLADEIFEQVLQEKEAQEIDSECT